MDFLWWLLLQAACLRPPDNIGNKHDVYYGLLLPFFCVFSCVMCYFVYAKCIEFHFTHVGLLHFE